MILLKKTIILDRKFLNFFHKKKFINAEIEESHVGKFDKSVEPSQLNNNLQRWQVAKKQNFPCFSYEKIE